VSSHRPMWKPELSEPWRYPAVCVITEVLLTPDRVEARDSNNSRVFSPPTSLSVSREPTALPLPISSTSHDNLTGAANTELQTPQTSQIFSVSPSASPGLRAIASRTSSLHSGERRTNTEDQERCLVFSETVAKKISSTDDKSEGDYESDDNRRSSSNNNNGNNNEKEEGNNKEGEGEEEGDDDRDKEGNNNRNNEDNSVIGFGESTGEICAGGLTTRDRVYLLWPAAQTQSDTRQQREEAGTAEGKEKEEEEREEEEGEDGGAAARERSIEERAIEGWRSGERKPSGCGVVAEVAAERSYLHDYDYDHDSAFSAISSVREARSSNLASPVDTGGAECVCADTDPSTSDSFTERGQGAGKSLPFSESDSGGKDRSLQPHTDRRSARVSGQGSLGEGELLSSNNSTNFYTCVGFNSDQENSPKGVRSDDVSAGEIIREDTTLRNPRHSHNDCLTHEEFVFESHPPGRASDSERFQEGINRDPWCFDSLSDSGVSFVSERDVVFQDAPTSDECASLPLPHSASVSAGSESNTHATHYPSTHTEFSEKLDSACAIYNADVIGNVKYCQCEILCDCFARNLHSETVRYPPSQTNPLIPSVSDKGLSYLDSGESSNWCHCSVTANEARPLVISTHADRCLASRDPGGHYLRTDQRSHDGCSKGQSGVGAGVGYELTVQCPVDNFSVKDSNRSHPPVPPHTLVSGPVTTLNDRAASKTVGAEGNCHIFVDNTTNGN
ncbi:uncharacterized protein LOC106014026, partial [Aplysia californica]|uniref:Uncharacterized protein LOC106014026 n=1 Tax=Aplysia californica TaxID=6500 RepID=A0ABM1AF49_APLCA